ncbi:MAG: nuclease-related domain-containing protein [Candidatus Promineifilaceae bacterium]|nr:nuclease-related domain-containing protein [Candidatus Promineifilaceae bacterium]
MTIIRDDQRIERMKRIGQWASLIGLLVLLGGLFSIFFISETASGFLLQTSALIIGWLLAQVGIYLTHRYVRSPRPDEVLDDALRRATKDGRLYHFVLPAPHVLLTRSGPIAFVLKYQTGRIAAEGDDWSQKGMGFLGFRRLFGQEGIGNPSNDARKHVKALANFISNQAPEVEEVPIGAIIVFTSKGVEELDVDDADIPAMHYTKLRGYLRQKGLGDPIPSEDHEALRRAFDEAAGQELVKEAVKA